MTLLAPFILLCLVIGEIYLFIQIGGQIGALATILLIFATAILGLALMRQQGLTAFTQAHADLVRGVPPFVAIGHGVLILFAGLLLLVPGFLTDTIGFLLLVPPIRQFFAEMIIGGWIPIDIFSELVKPSPKTAENGDIIDADFQAEDERDPR